MVFDGLSNFEKMEDPEERTPEELLHKKNKKGKIKSNKRSTNTVTLQTVRFTSTFVTAIMWITFLIGILLVIYKLLGAYTN